jgi:putative acetyltransferase
VASRHPPHSPTIRPEAPHNLPAIRHAHQAAFGQDEEARLVDALRPSPAFIPELSLVAEAAGRVVGHVLFSHIAVDDGKVSVPALALAPLAVLPACQGQGIGSQLVRDGLARARALGHRIVIVVGDPAYYTRFGFQPAAPLGLTCPYPVPAEAFMALELQAEALAGVQGAVVYPPAFDGV